MRIRIRKPPPVQSNAVVGSQPYIVRPSLRLRVPVALRIPHRLVQDVIHKAMKHKEEDASRNHDQELLSSTFRSVRAGPSMRCICKLGAQESASRLLRISEAVP